MGAPGIIVNGDGNTVGLYGTSGSDSFDGSDLGEFFFTGLGDDDVYAGGGDDVVFADLGNDFLDGGAGKDTLSFMNVTTNRTARASEFSVAVDLEKHFQDLGYFGRKSIYSFEDVTGTRLNDQIRGNEFGNRLVGDVGDDLLDGRGGADDLNGGDGNDTLVGGSGNDILDGGNGQDRFFSGSGADTLSGFAGTLLVDDGARDTFIFNSTSYSPSSTTRDTIYGYFDGANGDKIDLSPIDANGSAAGDGKFSFIGANTIGSTSTSQVQVRATGVENEYLVRIDTDSDSSAEMQLLVHSTSVLTSADFIL